MSRAPLDAFDRQILDLLAHDARTSNRKIATALGVTEGTIRARIKRLQEENYIRFTAVTDISYLGNPRLVFIGVTADPRCVRTLSQTIADLPGIRGVIVTLGRFNLLVIGMFADLDQVLEIANNAILSMPGVLHVESAVSIKTVKYDPRTAKITRPFVSYDDEEE